MSAGWARVWRSISGEYPVGRTAVRRPSPVVVAIVVGAVAGAAAAVLIAWTVGPLTMSIGFGL